MQKSKDEYRKLSIQVTATQEQQLKKMAAAENKSLSSFLRDIIFSANLDTAKIDFYQGINNDLRFLKRENNRIIHLLKVISHVELNLISEEKAKEYLNTIFDNSQKKK